MINGVRLRTCMHLRETTEADADPSRSSVQAMAAQAEGPSAEKTNVLFVCLGERLFMIDHLNRSDEIVACKHRADTLMSHCTEVFLLGRQHLPQPISGGRLQGAECSDRQTVADTAVAADAVATRIAPLPEPWFRTRCACICRRW